MNSRISIFARNAKALCHRVARVAPFALLGAFASKKVLATFIALNVPALLGITGDFWVMVAGGFIAAVAVEAMTNRDS